MYVVFAERCEKDKERVGERRKEVRDVEEMGNFLSGVGNLF